MVGGLAPLATVERVPSCEGLGIDAPEILGVLLAIRDRALELLAGGTAATTDGQPSAQAVERPGAELVQAPLVGDLHHRLQPCEAVVGVDVEACMGGGDRRVAGDQLVTELKLDAQAAQAMVDYLDRRLVEYEKGDYTYSLIKLSKPAA